MHLLRRRSISLASVCAAAVLTGLACARSDVPAPSLAVTQGPLTTPATATPSPAVLPPTPTPTLPPLVPPPSPTFPATPTLDVSVVPDTLLYGVQPGDTLRSLAVRFGVLPTDIQSQSPLPDENAFIDAGILLFIPGRLAGTGPAERLVPDSEVVFSPYAADFDPVSFAAGRGGFLSRYQEYVGGRTRSGGEVVALAALHNSVNPRLLLALLEYQAGWVDNPARPSGDALRYPLGHRNPLHEGLYRQLVWAANALGEGYYGWRAGTLTHILLADGSRLRLAPDLNAGTVALHYYLALHHAGQPWRAAVSGDGFAGVFNRLFGDPWSYDYPLFEPGVRQPELILPFLPGRLWSFTGGPHGAWEREAAWAALDFAPAAAVTGCETSPDWAVAAAPGLVVRSEGGVVALDLDGDGREQTGWVLIYLHLAEEGRVSAGVFVEQGDRLGHPSCEGGVATGTHIHLVRKYNGEWILADGPLPFELSGWVARAGSQPYEGSMVRGDRTVIACPCGSQETYITR